MRKTLTILFLFVSLLINAQTTYYIDPTGSDTNGDGSVSAPWKTLKHAVDTVIVAGDTIFVNAGTYTENVACELAIGVSIKGEGETSIITSTALTTEGVYILGLRSLALANGNQSISYLKFDGSSLAASGAIKSERRNGVKIHHCWFTDFNYYAVVWQGDGGSESVAPTNYITGSEFYNDTITNCAAYTSYAYGALYIGGQSGMLIHDNYITQTGRAAGTNGWPIKIWANGGWVKGLKIYNNTLFKDDLTYWDFCIEGLWHQGVEIYNNTITGAIDLNHTEKGVYDYGVYIHNNILGPAANSSAYYHGIILEFGVTDVIIRYNKFRNCSEGIFYTPRTGNTIGDNEISYNLFDDLTNGGWAIRLWGEDENNFTIGTFEVYNNVFFSKADDKALYGIGFSGADAGTISIINNIFINFTDYYGLFRWADNWDEVNIKNNIFYGNGNSNAANFYSSEFPPSYTNSGNLTVDPEFTGANDYTLQATSDAIDAGLGVGLVLDYLGNAVGASPDIGAYEYDSDPPDPPGLPEVTTGAITYTAVTANVSYEITSNGGGTLTNRGVVYSTSANPTITDRKTVYTASVSSFTDILRGLRGGVTYHARAYATNESGTSYGADVEFTTDAYSVPMKAGKVVMNNGKIIIIR